MRNITPSDRTTTGNTGVGLYANGTTIRIIDTDFYNNRADTSWVCMRASAFCLNGCANAVVSGCVITNNSINRTDSTTWGGSTVMLLGNSGGTVFRNCVIAGNKQIGTGYAAGVCQGVGVDVQMDSSARTCTFENCTVANNNGQGTFGGAFYVLKGVLSLRNSILHGNTLATGYTGNDIYVASVDASVAAAYDCLSGLESPAVVDSTGSSPSLVTFVSSAGGPTCFVADPLFVNAAGGNFRLMSAAGHWDPAAPGGWTKDPGQTSPCIDAGDPASDCSREPLPNGSRVNLGAYGGTPYASRTVPLGTVLLLK